MPHDPVFLITGASSGIGAATARQASLAGYRVVLAARSADKLEALVSELGGDTRALAVPTDVTRWEDNEALVARSLAVFGRIDVAFANAGFGAERGWLASTRSTGGDGHHERPGRRLHRAGRDSGAQGVAWADVADWLGRRAPGRAREPLLGHEVGRRPAMGGAIRADLNGSGVRPTLIEPGGVDTPFFDDPDEGRLKPEDIARAVLFAVSQPSHVDVNEILVRPISQASSGAVGSRVCARRSVRRRRSCCSGSCPRPQPPRSEWSRCRCTPRSAWPARTSSARRGSTRDSPTSTAASAARTAMPKKGGYVVLMAANGKVSVLDVSGNGSCSTRSRRRSRARATRLRCSPRALETRSVWPACPPSTARSPRYDHDDDRLLLRERSGRRPGSFSFGVNDTTVSTLGWNAARKAKLLHGWNENG